MHENILHNFLFKNFIFLVSLVILVRDFVLSRCLLSLRLTRRLIEGKRIDIWNVLKNVL